MTNSIDEYKLILLTTLRAHTDTALSKLRSIKDALPEGTRRIRIIVHLPQDAEGLFTVMVHLDGPDLFVLNKAISQFRSLFDVQFVEGTVTPDVPLFDPFDQPFSVNDTIVDVAMGWLKEVWATFGEMKPNLPVTVEGEDSFGTTPAMSLAV